MNTIVVLPNLPLSARISAGNYVSVNKNITEDLFPHDTTTNGKWEYETMHFGCYITSGEARRESEVDGWISASSEHLLAFGKIFPENRRYFPIVALGSVREFKGQLNVLMLGGVTDLDLELWYGGWDEDYRFLRVRRIPKS